VFRTAPRGALEEVCAIAFQFSRWGREGVRQFTGPASARGRFGGDAEASGTRRYAASDGLGASSDADVVRRKRRRHSDDTQSLVNRF